MIRPTGSRISPAATHRDMTTREIILERLGSIKNEVHVNKGTFTCGRMKDKDLVCLSLLVSRDHCLFTNTSDGFHVTDLVSSNGIFINGRKIKPREPVKLEQGDIIGIGCCDLNENNLDSTMFVYRIKFRELVSQPTFDCDNSALRNSIDVRFGRKELSRLRKSQSSDIPFKVIKTTHCNTDEDVRIVNSETNSNVPCQSSSSREIDGTNLNSSSFRQFNTYSHTFQKQIMVKSEPIEIIDLDDDPVIKKEPIESMSVDEHPINVKNLLNLQSVDESSTASASNKLESERIFSLRSTIDSSNPLQNPSTSNDKIQNVQREKVLPSIKKIQVFSGTSKDSFSFSNSTKENSAVSGRNSPTVDVENQDQIVKQEQDWGNFSQIDLADIEDEADAFPQSQLFDKSGLKEEDEVTNAQECQSSQFLDDEDENVITIIDSDDENDGKTNKDNPVEYFIKTEPIFEPEFIDVRDALEESLSSLTMQGKCDVQLPAAEMNVASNVTSEIDDLLDTLSGKNTEENIPDKSDKVPSVDDSSPSTSNRKDASSSGKSSKKRGPEIIEPHFIKPKKRAAVKEKIEKEKPKSKDKRSSSVSVKSKHKKKDKKEQDLKSVSNSKSKKSTSSGKGKTSNNSSSSSLEKSQDRSKKEATKKKTEEKASTSRGDLDQSAIKNRKNKVPTKVTTRSRGDMLCDSMLETAKPKVMTKKTSKSSAESAAKAVSKPTLPASYMIPRRQIPSSALPTNVATCLADHMDVLPAPEIPACSPTPYPSADEDASAVSPVLANVQRTHVTDEVTERSAGFPVLKNATNQLNVVVSPTVDGARESSRPSAGEGLDGHAAAPRSASPALKPSLVIPSSLSNAQKKVSFKENIAVVKEFNIIQGNKMRNFKLGLERRSGKKDFASKKELVLAIEDFLARVFVWEPVWLEQQQNLKELPPIVKKDDLLAYQKEINTFASYQEYYKRMEVLLMLETWQLLVKEYECTGNRYHTSLALHCQMERYSITQMQTANGLRYSQMLINTLVTKEQLRMKQHPVFGDMIIIEYRLKQTNKWRRAFAYVTEVQQQSALKFLRTNPELAKKVDNPHANLIFKVQTRIIDEHAVSFEQVARLRSILYLRSHLRLIQGLQVVPHSPLRDAILSVNIDEFQLESINSEIIRRYKLVTMEKLNEKQTEAVIKFTNSAIRMEPKISLLVGPPGTGKSKVVTNLVTQILYGDGRYVDGKQNRILVCAPSNAAIDEIVTRLLDIRSAIKDHRFKMVRIGRDDSMHPEVKKISLTELARREALRTIAEQKRKDSLTNEKKKHELREKIKHLEILLAREPKKISFRKELENFNMEYSKISNRKPSDDASEMSKLEVSFKTIILQRADIIACTLSSCYTSQMETIFGGASNQKIATCIVDEATQCCEAETLIPLMLGVRNLILVGDPNQLPATVMSIEAKKMGLDRSLFTRTKQALDPQIDDSKSDHKDPIIMLEKQYRMVDAISHWPNSYFYNKRLIDCVNYRHQFPFHPYRILDLDGLQDDSKFSNTSEAMFVGNLINCMMTCAKLSIWDKKITIGVITPYQNQKSVISNTIETQIKDVPNNIKRNKFQIEVNTIDSFQGQERDVVIMSCVRSSGIGFLSDKQRLCVALTRAKFSLFICGHFQGSFQRDNMWKELLRDARSRGVVVRLNCSAKPKDIKHHVVRAD